MNVLVIPDKFKGTLSAGAAAEAIARGWRTVRPHDVLDLLPMSDGGDGFGETFSALSHAPRRTTKTVDAAHRPCSAHWWWEPGSKTAIIESARIVGLAMLPPGRFHPFDLDTFGLGRILDAASRAGAVHCVVGIGGSATNDGGFGVARALGWRFLDQHGQTIQQWTGLDALARVREPAAPRPFKSVTVAVDVQNPLLGAKGATRVYGPQKGLRPGEFPRAEAALRRLARVTAKHFQCDHAKVPGAGAAGGLGFGLLAFFGARMEPGFELFARQAGLDRRLGAADLVITGEGSIDRSTLMGKGVGQVARQCRTLNIPCIGLAGVVERTAALRSMFCSTCALVELTTAPRARRRAAFWLEAAARRAAEEW